MTNELDEVINQSFATAGKYLKQEVRPPQHGLNDSEDDLAKVGLHEFISKTTGFYGKHNFSIDKLAATLQDMHAVDSRADAEALIETLYAKRIVDWGSGELHFEKVGDTYRIECYGDPVD